jgi:hypothetical protein
MAECGTCDTKLCECGDELQKKSLLHSTTMKRHVTCFVEKAGFEPRTLGTKAEHYDHYATRPMGMSYKAPAISQPATIATWRLKGAAILLSCLLLSVVNG